jgi:hypothetical protein
MIEEKSVMRKGKVKGYKDVCLSLFQDFTVTTSLTANYN